MSTGLVAVIGSVTPPGRLRRAVSEALERSGEPATLIDLAERRIAFAVGGPPEGDTAEVVAALAGARAVLLATPTYRGSMTGALKNLLDHTPVAALRDTAVGIVAMGASDHHFLGADRHLRDVLTFFGALVVPVSVYATSRDFDDGVPGERVAAELDALVRTTTALAAAGTVGEIVPLSARGRP
jgi:FMN reductase